MKVKKQFISMAVCIKCHAMDTTVMYDEDGRRFRECVACGFKDELKEDSEYIAATPDKDESVSVVSIIDTRKSGH